MHAAEPTGTRPDEPAPGSPAAGGSLPNLIIAGVTKAGTTSMFRYLSQHPSVFPSDEKELRHFLPIRYGEEPGPLEAYAAHFAGRTTQPYAMEASPGYFYGGRPLAEAIASTLDSPRVLIQLREPGQRCWSFYNFMRSRATLPQEVTFESYLDRCEQLVAEGRDQERENHAYSGLGAGCYARWLGDWVDVFGDRLRIEFFDDLAADPRGTVAGVCAWLGIDAGAADDLQYRVENKTTQFKFTRLQQKALAFNRRNVLFFERHQGTKRAIRRLYYAVNKGSQQTGMGAQARRRLDDFYAPHNEAVRAVVPPAAADRLPRWLAG